MKEISIPNSKHFNQSAPRAECPVLGKKNVSLALEIEFYHNFCNTRKINLVTLFDCKI
jgi:hypothetical protein